jgi:hypothetical protein
MSNIEDVLYEARELGIYEEVMDQSVIIKSKNPFMPIQDAYTQSLREIKNKLKK